MGAPCIAVHRTGLVTAVGVSAPASCAAIRAKISNPTETRFIDAGGEWIMAHQVPLEQTSSGLDRLAKMAAMAIAEAMQDIPRQEWSDVPLLLCVAESDRPGRMAGLEDQLLRRIHSELAIEFAPESAVIAHGRVSVVVALARARSLLAAGFARLLIAATDSLLTFMTLSHYERRARLLTASNSNGFMPGEGAGALLVGVSEGKAGELVCNGIGFGREEAHLESGQPLRAEGLSIAIKAALADAGSNLYDTDVRINDLSGEQYYFKEAALAVSRILRQRMGELDLWHPAECVGELGAAAGLTVIALADAACRKAYCKGPNILVHFSNDAGQRAALSLQFKGPA